ncbi:MAG: nitroreductase family protein [Chloroflexi bacterium]|nr:nitroreductase family protein [Chloroflexota bacterium]MCY3583414.1 nitroreductase family protein [Chloroflexota bacterium]MCY3715403.1 nitroreductase family protein [Chloroflexota bacterium]MDE2649612.1 nitroreductase family protein [Chloroflexota bacterium]MXV93525.1 nitroreductase family protein [Chloroflexota bacterium]
MTAADLLRKMRGRRSLRRYQAQPVPQEQIAQLLEAAIWAPSAHNRQPWRFVILQDAASKRQLATAMGAKLRQDLGADGLPPELIEADARRSYERLTAAPLLILLCLSMIDMDVYSDAQRNQHEVSMAQQSVAMAGQNILLMADSLGLGACWMCAPLFCGELVARTLDLPPDWQPQGLITLGYPAQQRQRGRQGWETRTVWR